MYYNLNVYLSCGHYGRRHLPVGTPFAFMAHTIDIHTVRRRV